MNSIQTKKNEVASISDAHDKLYLSLNQMELACGAVSDLCLAADTRKLEAVEAANLSGLFYILREFAKQNSDMAEKVGIQLGNIGRTTR